VNSQVLSHQLVADFLTLRSPATLVKRIEFSKAERRQSFMALIAWLILSRQYTAKTCPLKRSSSSGSILPE
jgi:hypothetical protein